MLVGIAVMLPRKTLKRPLFTGTLLPPLRISVHTAVPPVAAAYRLKVEELLPLLEKLG